MYLNFFNIIQLSNQDYSRAASRLNPDLLDGFYMLTLLLPGQAITYYGEEIGMLNGNLSWNNTINIKALEQKKINYIDYSKDKVRTPMQWDNTTSAGFSSNEITFIPVNSNYLDINVNNQVHNIDSNLEIFKKLAILRDNPIFTDGNYEINVINDNIFILKRYIFLIFVYI
jgi:alpha-glucosidase